MALAWLPWLLLGACAGGPPRPTEPALACPSPAAPQVEPPPEPACDDAVLGGYEGLLVLAPHPDDEILGFAGLIGAYLRQGKPVEVVISTDGDAYCEACRFWKSTSVRGPTCSAEDLSNFATPAVDSFAEVRRGESAAALTLLGAPAPSFLGYPDTGLAAVRAYRSQLGSLARDGTFPPSLEGLIDCSGYLLSFVRSTEVFVLVEP